MKAPTYNPIKMGDPVFAKEYGKKMLRYRKHLEKKQIEENRKNNGTIIWWCHFLLLPLYYEKIKTI